MSVGEMSVKCKLIIQKLSELLMHLYAVCVIVILTYRHILEGGKFDIYLLSSSKK